MSVRLSWAEYNSPAMAQPQRHQEAATEQTTTYRLFMALCIPTYEVGRGRDRLERQMTQL